MFSRTSKTRPSRTLNIFQECHFSRLPVHEPAARPGTQPVPQMRFAAPPSRGDVHVRASSLASVFDIATFPTATSKLPPQKISPLVYCTRCCCSGASKLYADAPAGLTASGSSAAARRRTPLLLASQSRCSGRRKRQHGILAAAMAIAAEPPSSSSAAQDEAAGCSSNNGHVQGQVDVASLTDPSHQHHATTTGPPESAPPVVDRKKHQHQKHTGASRPRSHPWNRKLDAVDAVVSLEGLSDDTHVLANTKDEVGTAATAEAGAQGVNLARGRPTDQEKIRVSRVARGRRQRERRRRDRAMAAARKMLVKKVAALGKEGRWREALAAVDTARIDGLAPDMYVYSSCVGAAAHSGRWRVALDLLRKMRAAGFEPNTAVYNAAIHACGSGGRWRLTLRLLAEMRGCRDIFPRSRGFVGEAEEAAEEEQVYFDSGGTGEVADKVGEASIVPEKAAGGSKRQAHRVGIRSGRVAEPDIQTFNTVMSACGRAGQWRLALEVMQAIRDRGLCPDRVTYNTAISACAKGGQTDAALELLLEMSQTEISPDAVSFNSAISACASNGRWESALTLLGAMKSSANATPDVFSFSSAIKACGNAGQWKLALGLLGAMKRHGIRSGRVAFNAAIDACAEGGQWKKALGLLRQMGDEAASSEGNGLGTPESAAAAAHDIAPDVVSYNAAIKACSDAGEWQQAVSLLEEMEQSSRGVPGGGGGRGEGVLRKVSNARARPQVPVPNAVSYSTTIAACLRAGVWEYGIGLLERMPEEGVTPTPATFTAAITACRKGGQARLVLTLLDLMRAYGVEPDPICYGAALLSCGEAMLCESALALVDEMTAVGIDADDGARRAVAVACADGGSSAAAGCAFGDDERVDDRGGAGMRARE